jgi:hypothetical protein
VGDDIVEVPIGLTKSQKFSWDEEDLADHLDARIEMTIRVKDTHLMVYVHYYNLIDTNITIYSINQRYQSLVRYSVVGVDFEHVKQTDRQTYHVDVSPMLLLVVIFLYWYKNTVTWMNV